ncbi:MAG: fused MFS/spermidine synthase [Thermodesulfobacteriota bacterium]
MESRKKTLLLGSIFIINFISLIYQVVWVREIMLIFGTTALSISTILTVFLSGIALGSYLCGKVIADIKNKYRFFGIALVILGIYCIASLNLFDLVKYPFLYLSGSIENPLTLNLLKFFFSFLILIIPTTVIGAMFPLVTYLYSREFEDFGRDVASVYLLDTLGASLGALLCGFFLIPHVGLWKTSLFSGLIYLGLGIYILLRHGVGRVTSDDPSPDTGRDKASAPSLDPTRVFILLSLFFSGIAALLLEVTWSRYFHLILGTSIYAFSIVIAAFLLGLSTGSLFMRKYMDKIRNPLLVFAYIEVLIAGFSFLVIQASGMSEGLYLKLFSSSGNFYLFQFYLFLMAFVIMFLPTALMGANFPLAMTIFARDSSTKGEDTGYIFSINTAGGILGSFAAGFIIIPRLGLEGTSILSSLAYLAIGFGAVLFFLKSPLQNTAKLSAVFLPFIIIAYFSYGEPVFKHAAYHYGTREGLTERFFEIKDLESLYFSKQGYYGLVTVLGNKKKHSLKLLHNGKTDGSTGGVDMITQLFLAYTPLFLHRYPEKVLNIGLGAGFTLGAIKEHPGVKSVDFVEIDPLVLEAVNEHFSFYNNDATQNPKVKANIDDGRHFLTTTKEKYDVIISEPPNVWVSGVSQLFTREFYDIAYDHLEEGGMFVQWLPFYDMGKFEQQLIIDTLRSRFRWLYLWDNSSDIILIATANPLRINTDYMSQLLGVPGVARDIGRLMPELGPQEVFSHFANPTWSFSPLSDEVKSRLLINTDDLPLLEFKTVKYSLGFKKTSPFVYSAPE